MARPRLTKILIDHERFGERMEFTTLAAAEAAIRECGPEFATAALTQNGCAIYDERAECVGRVAKT